MPADENGAVDTGRAGTAPGGKPAGPTIVCLQSGNVNTGACDDLAGAVAAAHKHGAWAYVDGAFGLWAAASPATRPLVAGIETPTGGDTDGHKWLNAPYDSGYAFCAHPARAPRRRWPTRRHTSSAPPRPPCARPATSCLSVPPGAGLRNVGRPLRELGAAASRQLVDCCGACALARRFATQLAAIDGISVVNDVVLNQVLVRFGNDDATTERVIEAVQRSGSLDGLDGLAWPAAHAIGVELAHHRG